MQRREPGDEAIGERADLRSEARGADFLQEREPGCRTSTPRARGSRRSACRSP
jgi:hypothetical protein